MPRKDQSVLDELLTLVQANQAAIQQLQNNVTVLGSEIYAARQGITVILGILDEPAPIAAAQITLSVQPAAPVFQETFVPFSKEHIEFMTKPKVAVRATTDFQLQDNGTVTGTISFLDAVGEPTTPQTGATISTSAVSSDPDLSVSVDTTGLILTGTVTLVTPLPTLPIVGITITATINISNPDGTSVGPLTAVSQGIDLVAGGPAGASISLG